MKLSKLIERYEITGITGDTSVEIRGIASDSRMVDRGYLFGAIKGAKSNGRDFIEDAVARGAAALIVEAGATIFSSSDIAVVTVKDTRKTLGHIAARFYSEPSKRMKVVGITGTNGKTTTSYLLEAIIKAAGFSPGVIGTVNYRYAGHVLQAPNTTPESVELQRLMSDMAGSGVTHCVMEVSSHALDQGRVEGCIFDTAIFTNLTRDHLDYHDDMKGYGSAKESLFLKLPADEKVAVINVDDTYGRYIAEKVANVISYSMNGGDISPATVREDKDGIFAVLNSPSGRITVESPLSGSYNLYNIMAATGAAISMGIKKDKIEEGLASLKIVPGRIEKICIPDSYSGCRVFVDYAHTPDALERVIGTLKSTTKGRLITLFGCGGDRDRDKRPLMGTASITGSDFTIITSDNPRSEPPLAIIEHIESGVRVAGGKEGKDYVVVSDRREAIKLAARIIKAGDTLLIAGKGHEDYQIVGDKSLYFDDRVEAEKVFGLEAANAEVA